MRVLTRMKYIPTAEPSNRQDAMTSALAFAVSGSPIARKTPFQFILAWLCTCVCFLGCETTTTRKPSPPPSSIAPYSAVLAVAPFTNESGVPIPVNEIWEVGDGVITAINETRGWDAVPLNRTIQTMRQMGINSVPDLKTASALAQAMDVDAIVLGTITQWDPYDPPRFGANVILVASDEATLREFDPRTLQGSTQERMPTSTSETLQCAQVVGVYDAAQHGTYESLKAYAAGRYDITGGFEPPERYYLMVYSRYLEYATWRLVDGLRDQETTRLARTQEKSSAQK